MEPNQFSEFIRAEREKYTEYDSNQLIRSANLASRYREYLSIIIERYEKADTNYRDESKRIDKLTSGFPASELEFSYQLRSLLLLEIECFYIMATTLLDKLTRLVLLYFGEARNCKMKSHRDFLKCFEFYFGIHKIPLPENFGKNVQTLKTDIVDFRDKKFTHQHNARSSLGISFPEAQGAFLNIGHFYPKSTDEPCQSKSLEVLLQEIDKYISEILSLLSNNSTRCKLKTI